MNKQFPPDLWNIDDVGYVGHLAIFLAIISKPIFVP